MPTIILVAYILDIIEIIYWVRGIGQLDTLKFTLHNWKHIQSKKRIEREDECRKETLKKERKNVLIIPKKIW